MNILFEVDAIESKRDITTGTKRAATVTLRNPEGQGTVYLYPKLNDLTEFHLGQQFTLTLNPNQTTQE